MANIAVLQRKCTGCGKCASACPFGAIEMKDFPQMNAACRVCGVCVRACPEQAIVRLETRSASVDKSLWKGILVYAEVSGGHLHPVSLELIGKAQELAQSVHFPVYAVLLGDHIEPFAEELQHYGLDRIYTYDDPELSYFRADVFADCIEDCIRVLQPSVVLVGATSLGRSLAPRLSTRFHTGLTADCTQLVMRENTDLVQIRPAFGGNIMAQIITANSRPQFATVRYKVMNAPQRSPAVSGEIVKRQLPVRAKSSCIHLVETREIPPIASISDAEILVAGGRGLQKETDLDMIRRLAQLLGGDWATSRPLVEKGWSTNDRQIGLSGRTVRPRLIICFGISGAIQFTSCMQGSDQIIAVNSDPDAPIFNIANIAIVDDLYHVLPQMIEKLEAKA